MEASIRSLIGTRNPNSVDIHLNFDLRITQQCYALKAEQVCHLTGK